MLNLHLFTLDSNDDLHSVPAKLIW